MLSTATKRVLGLGAIVGGILVIVLGVAQPNPFKQTRTYLAEFDSVQGLGAIGRDVRLAGHNVGEIGKVERDADRAVVELVLWEEFPVHTDARVDMRPHTLFEGSSFVDLSPGSPSAPELPEGGLIPNEQTTNYVTLDEALRILRPEIRESLADLAEVGATTLRGQAIDGIQRTLKAGPALFRNLKGPARAAQGPEGVELAGAIDGIAATVDAVAEQEAELIPLARRLNRTAAALTVDGGLPLERTLALLPGALGELRQGAPQLTALVDRLDRLAGEIVPALPEFTLAVGEATPLLERSIPILRRTTPLLATLRTVNRRVTATVPTLAELVDTLKPVVDTFGGSVLPQLLAPSLHGELTYRQLNAMFAAANGVWRPYQTEAQNPLGGAGHFWNLGTYVEPTGPLGDLIGGGPLPIAASACEGIERLNPRLARGLANAGGCP